MALYDNKYWLLSHIRNSFISTDDTGMSELIMAGEEGIRKQLRQKLDLYPDNEDSDDDDDESHESYDLQLDMDFGIRYRSNTDARLEKLDLIKKKTGRIKHIKWEMSKTPITQEQINELFIRKEPPSLQGLAEKQSLFTKTFKQYRQLPTNPYIEFAKFDGSGQMNIPTKKYRIFLTMLPEKHRNYPMPISCIATAKVHQLIGLILLKCSTNFEEYTWKLVQNYGLFITEDDGEVDRDFPPLDPREQISKFGFSHLGLVEHNESLKSVSFQTSLFFEDVDDKKSKEQSKSDQEKTTTDLQMLDVHNKAMQAPLYKSYNVYMLNKMKTKVEIHLGISGEKIEIDPVNQNSKFALVKQKAVSHHVDFIAGCEIIDTKGNKGTFKLIYCHPNSPENASNSALTIHSSTNFRHYEFETKPSIAKEVVEKVNLVLDLRSSDSRKEYLAGQEKKNYKKKGNL